MAGMNDIRTVCVYCGSGPGTNPHFIASANALGKIFAENGIRLVYGGGSLGMMGAVATSVLDHGGTVTGIIPDFLTARENALTRVQEMIVTPDMHERKRLMFERSDAFVALPGGIGTLEELVEQLTWQQLGRHTKPVLLANIDGFWEPLLALLAHMRATQFIRPTLSIDIFWPSGSRRSCRGSARPHPAHLKAPGNSRPKSHEGFNRFDHSGGNVTASMRLPSGSVTKAA
jgi:hypothetical protein